jgi:hypothetical protein
MIIHEGRAYLRRANGIAHCTCSVFFLILKLRADGSHPSVVDLCNSLLRLERAVG